MELLAPAGSLEQAYMAIENGCDALYGGLKNWNARKRAKNLSIEDYTALLKKCKESNVKFYLTLNTLLKTCEIDAIIDLFSKEDFIIPNAVIATDIGLISVLRNRFPELEIHASTQFGTTDLQDIYLLENLGVKRVILARELSFDEIAKVVTNTSLEVEVFVYGAQCVAFSGQCLLGGVLDGCSGNRGLCSGPCRELYSLNNNTEFFFEQRKIDASKYIKKLQNIGVSSIKIEGRARTSEEISAMTKYYRGIIDGSYKFATNKYDGYLSKEFMYNQQISNLKDCSISPFSYIYNFYYNKNLYKHTIFGMNKKVNGAIKLSFMFDNSFLIGFFIEDQHGKNTTYNLITNKDTIYNTIEVSQLAHLIGTQLQNILHYIKSEIPQKTLIKVPINELNEKLMEIKAKFYNSSIVQRKTWENFNITLTSNYWYETNNTNTVYELIKKGYHKIIFAFNNVEDLKTVVKVSEKYKNIVFKLPILVFESNIIDCLNLLVGKNIMLSKLSQIFFFNSIAYRSISLDYTANIWNKYSTDFAKKMGISMFTAHPELTVEDYFKISNTDNNYNIQYICFAKLPLGFSRCCFSKTDLCSYSCTNSSIRFYNVFGGYDIDFICDNIFGYRKLVPNVFFRVSEDNISIINNKRIVLSYMSEKMIDIILNNKNNSIGKCLEIYYNDEI